MLTKGELSNALEVYWQDAARCFNSKAFWCLLHVTVSLPDVCAALESPAGNATPQRYKNWCAKYFAQPALNGKERYKIRCKVLHQGRARPSSPGRYTMFAFGQPHSSGAVDHLRVVALRCTLMLVSCIKKPVRQLKSGSEHWKRTLFQPRRTMLRKTYRCSFA